MNAMFGLIGALTWCGGWIAIGVRREAARDARTLGQWCLGFTASSCLLVFIVLPLLGASIGQSPRWIHHAAFFALGGFLFAAELLRASMRHELRRGRVAAGRLATRRLAWLVELLPGPAAIAILLSGLRLIYEGAPGVSLRSPWLFYVVTAFGFFFADGLMFYQPTIRRLQTRPTVPLSRWSDVQLTVHALSFPVVYAVAARRPSLPHPFESVCGRLEKAFSFLPHGGPEVGTAVIVLGATVGFTAIARRHPGTTPARNHDDAPDPSVISSDERVRR